MIGLKSKSETKREKDNLNYRGKEKELLSNRNLLLSS
jgi:hypothetical protein